MRKPVDEKCAECKIILNIMTGTHVMAKRGIGRKTVCSWCAAELEFKNWIEVARAKEVG